MSSPTKHTGKYRKALAKIKANGLPVTFTSTTYSYNSQTGAATTPVDTEITGYAIEVPGDTTEYINYEVIEKEPLTFWFVPTTVGEVPQLGSVVNWKDLVKRTEKVVPLRPDGVSLLSKIIAVS